MLLSSYSHITFQQTYLRIFHFHPCYNNTYILLGIKHHSTQTIAHIDSSGRVIKQRIFYNTQLEQMQMINDRQIIVVNIKDNTIIQWNLQTNRYLEIPHLYMEDQILDITSLYIFPQTKLLCIIQLSNPNYNKLKLTYYQYPFNQQDNNQPITTFQSNDIWRHSNIVRKGNNHSMVCWANIQLEKQPVLKIFYIKQDNINGKYRQFQIQACSQWKNFENSRIQISIGNIWQIRPMQFIFISITNQPYNQQTKSYPCTKFIYCPTRSYFGRTVFKIKPQFNNQHIDTLSCGTFSMFRTYQFQQGLPIKSPIYYISNQTQQILQEQQWQCSHLYKYQNLYDGNGFVECLYENGNVKEITVKVKEMLSMKLIATFLMDQMVESCEDDLIEQVVTILKGQN